MLNKEKDLLILKEQYTQMDAWLSERIRTVLPALMQECEVNLWVVICSEYNEDPVFKTITPARMQTASHRLLWPWRGPAVWSLRQPGTGAAAW